MILVNPMQKVTPTARRTIPIEEEATPKAARYVLALMQSNESLSS